MKPIAAVLILCLTSCSYGFINRDVRAANEPVMRCESDWLYPTLDTGSFLLFGISSPFLFASEDPDGATSGSVAGIFAAVSLAVAIVGWVHYADCDDTTKQPWRM